MLKSITAALVAASVLIAPIAASAETAPTQPATTTPAPKAVKAKSHKRHILVTHVRGHKKIAAVKPTRHGKLVKVHKKAQVAAKVVKTAPKAN
ncbi:MAG TPA: hypothetical protein VK438_15705 [Xanthobacteraceae bacterium]|nr:hypothetical protein [Xanthobacteraceae bacterium]